MAAKVQSRVEGRWHHLEVRKGGEAVSQLAVPDLSIWLQGVQIRMGGIGGVATKPEHRMKGYARTLLEESVRYMTGLGQDVSMLFGISDFYNKFGFQPCLPEHHTRIATRDAERAAEGTMALSRRPIREDDHPFIVRLYNEDNRSRACAVVRDAKTFRGFRKGTTFWTKATSFVLEDARGERVAYAAFDENATEVKVIEVNATDRRAFWTVLHEFAKMAVERRTGQVELHMARDHAFVRFARRYGCRVESNYPRMGAGMMRILNQGPLFRKLRPALAKRLGQSEYSGRRVRLTIETDLGTTDLRFHMTAPSRTAVGGRLKVGQGKLTQLVVGYRIADDILGDPGVESEGEVARLLTVLFGGQEPYVWEADKF